MFLPTESQWVKRIFLVTGSSNLDLYVHQFPSTNFRSRDNNPRTLYRGSHDLTDGFGTNTAHYNAIEEKHDLTLLNNERPFLLIVGFFKLTCAHIKIKITPVKRHINFFNLKKMKKRIYYQTVQASFR